MTDAAFYLTCTLIFKFGAHPIWKNVGVGFMGPAAATHEAATERFWLHFQEVLVFVLQSVVRLGSESTRKGSAPSRRIWLHSKILKQSSMTRIYFPLNLHRDAPFSQRVVC